MKKNILLADDNKTFLMYIGLLLKRFGFHLLPAKNGLDALRVLKSTSADLVMLDVHMDTLDGITALRHIKSDDSSAHLPVIMISTDMSPETIKTCTDFGCFDYLKKPVKVDHLYDAIHRSFSSKGNHGRKHIRTTCNKKVVVSFAGKQQHLYAETFAEGGIYVRTENPLPAGSDVVVSLQLESGKQRNYKGKIVYTKDDFGVSSLSPGMAIQFTGLSSQEILELNVHVKTLVAGDILEELGEKKILET